MFSEWNVINQSQLVCTAANGQGKIEQRILKCKWRHIDTTGLGNNTKMYEYHNVTSVQQKPLFLWAFKTIFLLLEPTKLQGGVLNECLKSVSCLKAFWRAKFSWMFVPRCFFNCSHFGLSELFKTLLKSFFTTLLNLTMADSVCIH